MDGEQELRAQIAEWIRAQSRSLFGKKNAHYVVLEMLADGVEDAKDKLDFRFEGKRCDPFKYQWIVDNLRIELRTAEKRVANIRDWIEIHAKNGDMAAFLRLVESIDSGDV